MKVLLDLKKDPAKYDLLIYNGVEFEPISKDQLLDEVFVLRKQVAELENEFKELKIGVNDKLRTYHSILQVLTKEE